MKVTDAHLSTTPNETTSSSAMLSSLTSYLRWMVPATPSITPVPLTKKLVSVSRRTSLRSARYGPILMLGPASLTRTQWRLLVLLLQHVSPQNYRCRFSSVPVAVSISIGHWQRTYLQAIGLVMPRAFAPYYSVLDCTLTRHVRVTVHHYFGLQVHITAKKRHRSRWSWATPFRAMTSLYSLMF